jgi:ubiquinone/menaquinone biosynthesis C-methylase UbiE
MDSRQQRRVQRYGWDLAAEDYEPLWEPQLASAQDRLLASAALSAGERVLDVACGTGLVSLRTAQAVGARGHVVGIDISGGMIDAARRHAEDRGLGNATFERMDAESLTLPDASFDVVLCALGLMYMPEPANAVREMRRVLKPGGRVVIAVWGERQRCGWASLFPIVDAEVESDVCPLFFQLGNDGALTRLCLDTGFEEIEVHRMFSSLVYSNAEHACDAAFIGGPVALAWSRFEDDVRARVRSRYVESISKWQYGPGYRVPGEFVIVSASVAPSVNVVISAKELVTPV